VVVVVFTKSLTLPHACAHAVAVDVANGRGVGCATVGVGDAVRLAAARGDAVADGEAAVVGEQPTTAVSNNGTSARITFVS
jgi:hypothetical protein